MRRGLCGACDHLMDVLVIDGDRGNWETASSAFYFQPVWALCACGQHIVNFLHLVGVSVSVN